MLTNAPYDCHSRLNSPRRSLWRSLGRESTVSGVATTWLTPEKSILDPECEAPQDDRKENGRETVLKLTRILTLSPVGKIDQNVIAEAAAALRQGSLVVIPTDTVYGVAAHWENEKAVEMLRRIKGRPTDKPIPILASDCMKIENMKAHFGRKAKELARRFWPGPLTIVLPVNDGWEGFRIPKHPVALAIIKAAGGLLRVTSANLSGHTPALTADEALRELRDGVKLVIDSGPAPGGVPSTVVKITDEKVVVLREGAIPAREIYAACNKR